jgi:hypothetical protein
MPGVNTFIPGVDGKMYINPLKKAFRAFHVTIDDETVQVPANQTIQTTATITQDINFAAYKTAGRSDDEYVNVLSPRMLVSINNPWLGWELMNRPVHMATCIGLRNGLATETNTLHPHMFAQPMFLPGPQALVFTLQDFSGVNQNFQCVVGGRQLLRYEVDERSAKEKYDALEKQLASRITMPYWLTTDRPVVITNNNVTELTFPMSVPPDAHFEAHSIMAVSTSPFRWSITDTYSGKWWHNRLNNPVGLDSRYSVGDARFPWRLEEPTFVMSNNRIMLTILNLGPAIGTNQIFFTIHGRLLMKNPQDR